MKFAFIAENVAVFSIRGMCRLLQVSPSGYYAWLVRPKSDRECDNEVLALEIEAIHEQSRGTYGSPRITHELHEQGRAVSKKRVAKRMKERGIQGKKRRRFRKTTDSKHGLPVPPNLLARDFTQDAPNKVWVTDVTAIYTATGWLYLAVILDLFSRSVVGWATSSHNDTNLALAALDDAAATRRPPPGLIHHSDRGSPYASEDYRKRLDSYCMVASMSRTGDCWDNAVAESFFATIKCDELDHQWYPSQAAAHAAIDDYITNFYNPVRRHSTLGYLSPDEFELRSQVNRMAA